MAKRRRFLGSAPCLDNRSEHGGKQHENLLSSKTIEHKVSKREAKNNLDETIILRHWYRFGYDTGENFENNGDS
jgi:hypothetical protein